MAHGRRAALPPGGFVPTERLLDCVHCGLCQTACPTYLTLGTEADSPRGRIHLMRALQEGRLTLDADAVGYLDRCLGCRGCETACPSGVAYGELIEAVRPWVEARYRRPLPERWRRRLIVRALTTPRLLRALVTPLRALDRLGLLASGRALAARVVPGARLLPTSVPPRAAPPSAIAAGDARAAPVHLVPGCVMPELCGDTVRSTARVLAANGWRVIVPPAVGCCGALALHAGERGAALAAARRTLDALVAAAPTDDGPPIVVTAAGCGAMMKGWGALFTEDPARAAAAASVAHRVRDATELLASRPLRVPAALPPRRVAYHDPCHLAHAQGIRDAPRALLAAIPGVTLVAMEDEDLCCGSAGHYNVMQPAMARTLVARKVAAIRASGVDLVATANAGCALQLAAGLRAAALAIPVRHVVELLAEAYDRY
ncbi:MAG: 4Fe-4S dicluster domain-containing protein [Deltaproteobacteria bacterium]|nr:4Fe-4S dicluster domain-containing protein [Deltaproteobacteria bacterium]